MAYGRAPKGDEKAQDRLVEEIAEREEGVCVRACVRACGWWAAGGGVVWLVGCGWLGGWMDCYFL
jgi:hypothetical protein